MKTSMRICAVAALVYSSLAGGPALAAGAADLDAALAAVETGVGQIEKSGRITGRDDLDAVLDRYQAELLETYAAMVREVEKEAGKAVAARQKGTAAAAALQAWEDQMARHRARIEKVVPRLTAVNMKVRDGSIVFAPELLKTMPADEVEELRRWLTPEAIRKYRALDRSLFAAGPVGGRAAEEVLAQELGLPDDCPQCRPRSRSLLVALNDLLAPDAEAAIAAGCVAVCAAQPEGCIPCLIVAGFGADQVVKLLDRALEDCNRRRTRVGRALCKTAVILGFIATIG